MIHEYLEKIKKINNVSCLKATIYARYSSDLQRGESIEAQIRLIKLFAKQHNIIITSEYIDNAKSAKNDDREQFQNMITESKTPNCNWQIVLVHKLDRFARNRYDSANYRVVLRKNNKFLISATEQLDDSPESIMLEAVIEAMSEYYSKNLSREVMKGLTQNAYNGLTCGGMPPLGYDIIKKRYVLNEFEANAVKIIFSRFLDGVGYGQIINELNELGYRTKRNALFSKNSLYEILRNEKYTGCFVYNRQKCVNEFTRTKNRHSYKSDDEIIRVDGVLPVIISKEDFSRVQKILDCRKRAYSNNAKEVYLLTGKIECGVCGGSYVGTRRFSGRNKVKYVYYVCNVNERSAHKKCDNGCISRDLLERYVLKIVSNILKRIDDDAIEILYRSYVNNATLSNTDDLTVLQKALKKVESDIKRIVDVIDVVNSSSLLERLSYLERQQKDLQQQIFCLEIEKQNIIGKAEFKVMLEEAQKMLEEKSIPRLKDLIDLVVSKIVINKDDIKIYLNFYDDEVIKKNYIVKYVGQNGRCSGVPKSERAEPALKFS